MLLKSFWCPHKGAYLNVVRQRELCSRGLKSKGEVFLMIALEYHKISVRRVFVILMV